MTAATYDITLDQGSDYSTTLQVSGQTLDGYGARGQIRPNARSDQLSAEFSCTVTGGTSIGGTVEASLTHTQTSELTLASYSYDIEVFNTTTDKAVRLVQGKIFVNPGVTRT
tara:strand:+ start:170 stop:505 length:336 start_codon:yes stop_codon:yes gene_type:complete